LSNADRYIEILKLQATTFEDRQAAKDAIRTMELYGYKAVPALRDVLETITDDELKNLTIDVLKNLGWAYPSSDSDE
jgi:hypothetical protein